MKRVGWLLVGVLMTMGAAPKRPLPVPPIPPAHPPSVQTAPLPDRDLQAPAAAATTGTQLDMRNFRVPNIQQGMRYTPGSQFRTSDDKRPVQTPGLTVRVPLQ